MENEAKHLCLDEEHKEKEIVEKEIRFKSDDIELAGTFTILKKMESFYSFIHYGFRTSDRNENHKKLPINAFRDISHYLANMG